MRALACAALALAGVGAGCNSLVGFDLEGGGDGGGNGDTKTLVVSRTGDMRGAVTSMPSGINCSPTVDRCSQDFPRGSTVTLTAVTLPGSRFSGWTGGGCQGTGTCVITLAIDNSIEAAFEDAAGGHNFAFVTTDAHPPSMWNPISRADALCAADAAAAGLPAGHTYVAWLSTSTMDAKDRLAGARGWVRIDGQPIADTVADLTSNKMLFPIRITAAGAVVGLNGAGHSPVATGTALDGTKTTSTCTDWSSTTTMVRIGNAQNAGQTWTDWFDGDAAFCANLERLLCFGTDRNTPLTVARSTGRLAFVTAGAWAPGGGIATADAFCQTEANAASRSGTFKALLATTTASAASRMNMSGSAWVRADGMPLAAPGATPFDGLQTPINVRADGSYTGGNWVAIGAASLTQNATANKNCNDWNVGNAAGTAAIGWAERVPEAFTDTDPNEPTCDNTFQLYCFEQ
jgi:hypothetical protein